MKLSDLGNVKPTTRAVARLVVEHLDSIGTPLPPHSETGRPMVWGYSTDPSNTEHHSGYALDFMVESHAAIGNAIADYLWHNRVALGVRWIIWRQRIRNPERAGGRWRRMDDRGSDTDNHMDHVHVMLDGRAPTGGAANPGSGSTAGPPFPLPRGSYFGPRSGPPSSVSGYYSHRAALRQWQTQMKRRGWQIAPDGLYGGQTRAIARKFQAEKGLAVDGLIGPATWLAAWRAPIT